MGENWISAEIIARGAAAAAAASGESGMGILRCGGWLAVMAGMGTLLVAVHRSALWGPAAYALAMAAVILGGGRALRRAARPRSTELTAATLRRLDRMGGAEFEDWVAAALGRAGFRLERLRRTRDFGVDVVAVRGHLRVGVQAKRYRGAVGNSAVQQAIAGAGYHGCQAAAVVTQSRFTSAAERQAAAAPMPVLLIDRAGLDRLGAALRRLRV